MKYRILSILMALALCLSLFPAPARAAGTTLTKPLDFTNVGDGDGQTPASGDGYTWKGDSNGYTLMLDGISINITEFNPDRSTNAAILLPKDGPTTIELKGNNTITSTFTASHAIATMEPGKDDTNTITVQGSGSLTANVPNAIVLTGGGLTIKNVTITGTTFGDGLTCVENDINIENANISIASGGNNAPAIYAGFAGDISIVNSTVTVSSADNKVIEGSIITIKGGTVKASSSYAKSAAIICDQVNISDEASVTATGEPYGLYVFGNVTLSQSEVTALGKTAAIYATGDIVLKSMAIIEPVDGKIGTNVISNGDDTNATSAKLAPVALNVPASPLTCTYGDPSVSVILTTTPAITSTVEIYNGTNKLGEGNLGEEITINTSGLSAGNATFTAKLPNELGEKDFTVTVKPKSLTVTRATATNRDYDGTKEVEVTAVTLDGVLEADKSNVSVNTANLKGTISGAGVGTYDSVTLPEMTLTGAKAGNYTLTQPTGTVPASVVIYQADYEGLSVVNTSARAGATGTYDLTNLIQGIDGAVLEGTSIVGGDIFEETPTVSGNILSYKLKADVAVGSTNQIQVPMKSTNYVVTKLRINVTVTDKDVPALTVSPITVAYNGEAVPDGAIQGTATVNGQTVPGTWSFAEGQALTYVADSGAKAVKFTPEGEDDYAAVETTVTVTINKATPTDAPTYTAISASSKTLADAGLTAPAGWPEGVLSWNLPEGTEVTANTRYEWTFTPEDNANYERLGGVITLWVQNTGGGSSSGNSGSSGGGSGSGDGSQTTLPVTTTGQNSSAQTTTTIAVPSASVSGGRATATVNTSMGSEIVKQAVANDSENVVIAPKVTGDVTRTEVSIPTFTVGQIGSRTGASLTVTTPVADVTIPNGGLGSLAGAGGTVTVTAQQTDNTVELSVAAGGKTVESIPGGLTLTVPAKNTTPGTVAVLAREDGTREVVRKSVAADGAVTIPLEGSARLEIVDNSRQFDDVPDSSWAAGAVAFASAHELFSGTGANHFSPSQPMSRGMLAVVLHNLENNPNQALTDVFTDVDNNQWYAEGVTWAAARGIIRGYGNRRLGPNDNITREQLAVMLWRYAGSPAAADRELHFADADKASGWAVDALRWAAQNGILNGKGNGILDPAGQATRGETAQMLMRFCLNRK